MIQQLSLFDQVSSNEGIDLELKAAKGGLPKSLWETYSAFANTEGGIIILGVSEVDGQWDVHGVADAHKMLGDFWNTVNSDKVSCNLLSNTHAKILPYEGKTEVIWIDVPRADRRHRPVYIGHNPLAGSYRRNHEGDYRCTEDEVRRMFADQAEETVDSRILEGFSEADLDADSLKQYRNLFASRAPDHPWLVEDDKNLLCKLGGWRRDRITGKEGLTLAGLLMFGRGDVIGDAIPSYHMDYRERLADDSSVRWSDRVTLDGSWQGNLFQFYRRVIGKLSATPAIRLPFQQDSDGVRQASTSVHEGLQEALVNALIHGDYAGQGGVVIDRYPDHFEFSNPGTLLLSLEQLQRGGISECRNRSLQKMFFMMGAGDKAGSGLDKIRRSWQEQHWRSPVIQETLRPDRVSLELPTVSMAPPDLLGLLRQKFGEVIDSMPAPEVQALVTAAQEGQVSNHRLQQSLNLHRVDITQLLQSLVGGGYLVSEGIGRGTRYLLAGEAISPRNELSSPHNELSSPHNGDSSPLKQSALPGSPQVGEPWRGLDASEKARLETIAGPVSEKKRAAPDVVKIAILGLCEGKFLSIRELAHWLNRSQERLRDRYVSPMVEAGQLELKHPAKPNHRDQGYRTRGSA